MLIPKLTNEGCLETIIKCYFSLSYSGHSSNLEHFLIRLAFERAFFGLLLFLELVLSDWDIRPPAGDEAPCVV